MSKLRTALELAEKGFYIFPLAPGTKDGCLVSHKEDSTRDPEQIKRWWLDPVMEMEQPYNVGISTHRFGEGRALLVIDVDNKGEKNGDQKILELELQGFSFPPTLEQRTPTGGRHLIYWVATPVKQGVDVLGEGLDTRSRGGYIVGCGSEVERGTYASLGGEVAPAPEWLLQRLGRADEPERTHRGARDRPAGINAERARERAAHYLRAEAPISVKGQGGDATAYKVAARVKDFGVSEAEALELMLSEWNGRSPTQWSAERLQEKVAHAYRYGTEVQGAGAPEAQFAPIDEEESAPLEKSHPFIELNKEYAFVIAGGGSHILWETEDHRGNFRLEHLALQAFHQKHASRTMMIGEKSKPITELWMRDKVRRSYDGICFMPGLESPPRFYNLWRGFAVEPYDPVGPYPQVAVESVEMFLDHAKKNVCRGDEALFNWLMGYFAHLVQRPWEKPLVALVFRGKKGVGKNALVDRVGALLGSHYLLTANRRYLIGNFNGHLENLLLFVLDEAFWSGDKQAEGTLKDLITGKTHVIEHKGKEPYAVENCTRVCIIGNEEWLVPASQDERRFAVFDVGDGRKQDRNFFLAMREGMERGGYRLLLRFLLDFSLEGIEVNAAPNTAALLDQKVSSLEPFEQWWLDCLTEGKVVGSEFGEWPYEIPKESFRNAFRRHVKERQIRSRIPEDRIIGKRLKGCLPGVDASAKRREGSELVNVYRLPSLEEARKQWDRFIGHPVVWEVEG